MDPFNQFYVALLAGEETNVCFQVSREATGARVESDGGRREDDAQDRQRGQSRQGELEMIELHNKVDRERYRS